MSEGLETVAGAVDRVRDLLLAHGDEFTVPRLSKLADRLRSNDRTAIVSAVSEATGGMGSLNDSYLCRENGDKIGDHEVNAVNKRLTSLVKEVEATARAAAAVSHVRLLR